MCSTPSQKKEMPWCGAAADGGGAAAVAVVVGAAFVLGDVAARELPCGGGGRSTVAESSCVLRTASRSDRACASPSPPRASPMNSNCWCPRGRFGRCFDQTVIVLAPTGGGG